MRTPQKEIYGGLFSAVTEPFLQRLDRCFDRLYEQITTAPIAVRTFCNATSASVVYYLPDGAQCQGLDYHYVKTDATANTVTIVPYGTQLIMATSTLVLTTQGDSAWLAFDHVSQTWWLM